MNGGHVERVFAVAYAKEPGRLLEGFRSEARHGHELHAREKPALLIAKLHNFLRSSFVDSGNVSKQCVRRSVQVHADTVHAGLDGAFERFPESPLIHVMLILTYADRLRIDLHQFSQRILQASRDGNGPTDGKIQCGKLLTGDLRSRVNGSS